MMSSIACRVVSLVSFVSGYLVIVHFVLALDSNAVSRVTYNIGNIRIIVVTITFYS